MMVVQQIEVVREEELTGCGRRRRTGSRGGVTLKDVDGGTTPRSGLVLALSITVQEAAASAMHSFVRRDMKKERKVEN